MLVAASVVLVCIAIDLGALTLWFLIFQTLPGIDAILEFTAAICAVAGAWMLRYGPPFPMKGRPPEEIAAEKFLSGEDVRPDDHRLDLR